MKKSKCVFSIGLVWFVACLASSTVSATDNFSIDWFSIDGAAATAINGGVFSIEATSGQPDSGPVTLAGGSLLIKGGFWALDFSSSGDFTPAMQLQQTGPSELLLSWYPDAPGFRVQQSLTLAPNSWTDIPAEPVNPLILPLTGDHLFFRLIKP